MATAKLSDAITRLGRLAPSDAGATDPDLIARFLADRDEGAFALLVRRHGPMVFGVCRRVTGHHHLAEDAFQAVFVVLAAKAGSVRPRAALSAWLYAVAYRTALRARTMRDRRRRREADVETLPEPARVQADAVEAADLAAVIDAEVARLPDHLRVPVVMCELEGRARPEVAAELGIPEGTLSSRLAAARKALAGRLRQRGVALSAAGLTAALGQAAGAKVPADLAARAAAGALSPGVVPARVAALSNGVLRVMFAHKLKSVPLALGLAACALLAGGLLFAMETPGVHAPGSPKTAPVLAFAPAADEKPRKVVNRLVLFRSGGLVLVDPDGKNELKLGREARPHPGGALLSPDGTRLAMLLPKGPPPELAPGETGRMPMSLHVRGLDEKEPGTDLGVQCQVFCWSPDGTQLACCEFEDGRSKPPNATHFLVDVKTKKRTDLKLPADHVLTDWSRDGKFFVTMHVTPDKEHPKSRVYLMHRDGTAFRALTDEKQTCLLGRVSPDGKKVLFHVLTPSEKKPGQPRRELAVVDVATRQVVKVADVPLNGGVLGYCWSPDGKRIAYTWRQWHSDDPKEAEGQEAESHLIVCDPDGKNQKTLLSEKGKTQWEITLGQVDWGLVPEEALAGDEQKLAGAWSIESITDGGKERDPKDGTMTFGKGKVTITADGKTLEETYTLDPSKKPKWIDLTIGGKTMKGLYELDGDGLKFCFNEDADGERPTEFASKAGTPNDLLIVLKRKP